MTATSDDDEKRHGDEDELLKNEIPKIIRRQAKPSPAYNDRGLVRFAARPAQSPMVVIMTTPTRSDHEPWTLIESENPPMRKSAQAVANNRRDEIVQSQLETRLPASARRSKPRSLKLLESKIKRPSNGLYQWVLWKEALKGEQARCAAQRNRGEPNLEAERSKLLLRLKILRKDLRDNRQMEKGKAANEMIKSPSNIGKMIEEDEKDLKEKTPKQIRQICERDELKPRGQPRPQLSENARDWKARHRRESHERAIIRISPRQDKFKDTIRRTEKGVRQPKSRKAKLPKLLQLTMRRKKGVRESKNDAKFQRFEAPSKPKFDPGEDFQDRVRKSLRNRNCAGKTLSNKLEALTANSTKRPLRLCRTRQRTTTSTRRNFVRLKV